MMRSLAQQEGNKNLASYWISDLICEPKGQKELKQNNVKIKEGVLVDLATVLLGFSFTWMGTHRRLYRWNPYRNHLPGNAAKLV